MRRRFVRLLPVATVLGALIAVAAPAKPAEAVTLPIPVPGGYVVTVLNRVSAGVTHVTLASSLPSRLINVVVMQAGASERLRVAVSNERIASGTETVRSMCSRMRCLAATNGDFYAIATGQPSGGMASRDTMLRSSSPTRYNLTQAADGTTAIQQVTTTTRFFATYPDHTEPFFVAGFNVGRPDNQAVLYTDRWASTTQTGSGFEIVLEPLVPGTKPVIGDRLRVRMVQGFAAGSAPILPGRLVLSASGTYAGLLSNLWSDVLAGAASAEGELTVTTSPDVQTFTGGNPPLLLDGARAFQDNGSTLFAGHAARTMAGRTADGSTMLVTVDASAGHIGMTMVQAMDLMRSLGAVDALNMDGGGSSTFFLRRWVANLPSGGGERSVATAVTIVANRWS